MTTSFDQATTAIADEPPFERWADRFRLLSDPSRLRILSVMCQGERNVTEICRLTSLNQANVSKHLQLLKAADAVACRRVGICRYYRIIDDDLFALCPQSFADIQH